MVPDEQSDDERPGRSPGVARRRALEVLLAGGAVAVLALLGVPVLRYLRPLPLDARLAVAEIDADALGLWEARILEVGGRPAVVVRTPEGYAALSAVCTHLGCVVKWKKGRQQFFCPCHGARFGLDGRVLGGPVREPLEPLAVQEIPGKIVVRPT